MSNLRKAITIDVVKRIGVGETVWDTKVAGFGVRRQRSESRTYILKVRVNGRQRWITIGRHGSPWTPDSARKKANRLLADISDGIDIVAIREEQKQALTISELCDLYLEDAEAGKVLTKFGVPKKASTLSTDRGRILRHIKPLIGDRLVKDVTSNDVKRFMNNVAIGKTAKDVKTGSRGRSIVKGGRGTATRTVGLLGGIFSYAIERGYKPDEINPVQGVKRFPDKKEDRFLTEKDFSAIGIALTEMEREGTNPYALLGIRLLMLTGCRKSEILSLKWKEVDFETGCLRLADSKTGRKVVLLGAPPLDLLRDITPLSGNPYVLPGQTDGHHLVGLPKIWNDLRVRAGIEWATLHILRHSFASFGAGSGLGLPVIGHLLGHKDSSTTARYAKVAVDPAKLAAESISSGIAKAIEGKSA